MKKIILILFSIANLQAIIVGQIEWRKEFILNSNGVANKIKFIDTKTNQEKIYNLIEENPYRQFHYPSLRNNESGHKIYNLGGYVDKENYFSKTSTPIHHVEIMSSLSKEHDLFTAICYNLISYDLNGEIIGIKSSIVILDSIGDSVAQLSHINIDARQPVVSPNGKYIAFICGGQLDIDGFQIYPEAVRLYEICSEKLLYEELAEKNESFYSPVVVKNTNMFRISSKIKGVKNKNQKIFTARIFDLEELIMFSNVFSQNKRNNLHAVDREGFIFKTEDGLVKEYYLLDFQQNKL